AERLEHIAVTDLGADKLDPLLQQCVLEPQIAHHGAYYRSLEPALFFTCAGQDEQQLVTVDDVANLVDHHDAITVAIQRDADVSLDRRHGLLQEGRIRRAAAGVDISAVWRTTYR